MLTILNTKPSILNPLIGAIRQGAKENDRKRFRSNLERLGTLFAYEISKTLAYERISISTPLGEASELQLVEQPVLGTIIRAGIPLYQGMLDIFDKAESAFFAVYRKTHKSHDFQIEMQYLSIPNLNQKTLILSDAVIGTGKSMVHAYKAVKERWNLKTIYIVAAIASEEGLEHIKAFIPNADIWIGALDKELTSKSLVVPGLGDAGDLAYGCKIE